MSTFLEFSKSAEEGSYKVVHRTEVVRWTCNPRWKKFSIPVRTLCGNDYDRDLTIACYDWSPSGSHTLIGTILTYKCRLELK